MADLPKEEGESEAGYNTYSPCYYLQLVARSVLKCLGLDSSPPSAEGEERRNQTSYQDDDPTTTTTSEEEMKSSEDVGGGARFSFTAAVFRRAPTRPSVGTGRPPQINDTSS